MFSPEERHWRLAGELATMKISTDAFCAGLGMRPADMPALASSLLRCGAQNRDARLVEFGLFVGHSFAFLRDDLDVLERLAGEDWHISHENIVAALSAMRSPSSIDALYGMALARYAYRDYDEAFSLAVACIWALGGIESAASIERLRQLLSSDSEIVADNAARQLVRARDEWFSSVLREAAGLAVDGYTMRSPED